MNSWVMIGAAFLGAMASMGFVVGDAIKAVVASLAAAGLSKLGR